MPDVKTKPVIFSEDRSDAERFDPRLHLGSLDPGRIPGYSEIVQANDIARADALEFREKNLGRTQEDLFKEIGANPRKLDVEFQWLRIIGPSGVGSPNARRELDHYTNQEGFRLATEEDLTSRGFDFPPQAWRSEDGTIRRGSDVALYVRSGEVARMWERFRAEEAAQREGNSIPQELAAGGYRASTFEEEEVHETVEITH